MKYSAAVITISDSCSAGQNTDTSGPAVCALLTEQGWEVCFTALIPDDMDAIREILIRCADELKIPLVLTTGGTGFSPRDITPEATLSVIQRQTPGIPEAMRAESMRITPRGCLSRSAAGIRNRTLIINLPGSRKAALENLGSVLDAVRHGVEMMLSSGSANCAQTGAVIRAVCISEKKGEQKHPVDEITLKPDHGIIGDAHAGNWHRQVSLLGIESVQKLQDSVSFPLMPGAFAENILTEGIELYRLAVGTRLTIGSALCEITQIGKECHSDCAIRKAAGDCVMPREGIFVRVLQGGNARAGDTVTILQP